MADSLTPQASAWGYDLFALAGLNWVHNHTSTREEFYDHIRKARIFTQPFFSSKINCLLLSYKTQMLSISATSPLGKMHLAKHTAQSLSRGEVFIICMNCYNRIKALKELPNIAPGEAQQTQGIEDRNNHRRTENVV